MMADCIEWTKYRNKKGYGRRTVRNKQIGAHRQAWIDAHGAIPDGMWVLHTCDNPSCINIEHLYVGTNTDNMRDMARRERGSNTKLTATQIIEIRNSLESSYAICTRFSVSASNIRMIRSGRTWKEVPN